MQFFLLNYFFNTLSTVRARFKPGYLSLVYKPGNCEITHKSGTVNALLKLKIGMLSISRNDVMLTSRLLSHLVLARIAWAIIYCGNIMSETSTKIDLATIKKSNYPNVSYSSCKGCCSTRALNPANINQAKFLNTKYTDSAREVLLLHIIVKNRTILKS